MDAAGIDVQVISHMQPGTQIFDAETAVAMARKANDALYAVTRAHPARFAGLPNCPPSIQRPPPTSSNARSRG